MIPLKLSLLVLAVNMKRNYEIRRHLHLTAIDRRMVSLYTPLKERNSVVNLQLKFARNEKFTIVKRKKKEEKCLVVRKFVRNIDKREILQNDLFFLSELC